MAHSTTTGPASISYWTGGGTSTEDVTGDWKKSITSKDLNITSLTVSGSYTDKTASVSCVILIEGRSAGKSTGASAGAHAIVLREHLDKVANSGVIAEAPTRGPNCRGTRPSHR
ncbi:MAG: hypothetical protein M3017_13240 [Actinomycetota bacterium]|nr:hypothetical protein [Actinomycetota bacterium]